MTDGLFGLNDPPSPNVAAGGCTACGQRLVHAATCPVSPSNVDTPPEVYAAVAALIRLVEGDEYCGVQVLAERRPGGVGIDVKVTLQPRVPSGMITINVIRGGDHTGEYGTPCQLAPCLEAGRTRPCNGPHDCAQM